MNRRGARWNTPFGRFIRKLTVDRLVANLRRRGVPVTNQAVYQWVAGSTQPRLEVARALISISRGRVRLDHIYKQRDVASQGHGGEKGQ